MTDGAMGFCCGHWSMASLLVLHGTRCLLGSQGVYHGSFVCCFMPAVSPQSWTQAGVTNSSTQAPNKAPSPWNKYESSVSRNSLLPELCYQRLLGSPYILHDRKIPFVERKSMNVSGTRCICKQKFGSHLVSFLNFILEMVSWSP